MAKFVVFTVLSGVIVFCMTVFFRLGGYKSPTVELGQSERLILISKSHIGAYHKINDVIVEVESWAAKNQIPCKRTFGEFLDNPKEKDEDRLRSEAGCILATPLAAAQVPEGFHYRVREPKSSVLAKFDGAPSIGPFKVYPAVEDFMKSQHLKINGPVIEIYESVSANEATTHYIFDAAAE